MPTFDQLRAFRQAAYERLGKARDATFELTDAVLLTRNAYSLADLSLCPVFRRKWPSIYEALQDSRPQRQKLMKLYIEQIPASVRPILAGDHTIWPRPEAVTLQERTIEHCCTAVPRLEVDDPKLGLLRIRLWSNLHFRGAASHPMQLLRIERMELRPSWRLAKPLWLAWMGEKMPPIDELWRLYLRRFGVDHWYRFAKQRLHWTLPKLSTPKQCERWSDLMPLMSWELWLARDIVTDNPLPWHKSIDKLTPGRVAQAFAGVLAAIDTPAQAPKPRGKSPGWPPGQARQPRTRYPLVKKGSNRVKKRRNKSS